MTEANGQSPTGACPVGSPPGAYVSGSAPAHLLVDSGTGVKRRQSGDAATPLVARHPVRRRVVRRAVWRSDATGLEASYHRMHRRMLPRAHLRQRSWATRRPATGAGPTTTPGTVHSG